MTKFRLLFLLVFALPIMCIGQKNNYYYYNAQKVSLEIDYKLLNITYNSDFVPSSLTSLGATFLPLSAMSCNPGEEEGKVGKVEFAVKPSQTDFYTKINTIKGIKGVTCVALYYVKSVGKSIGTSNVLYVKLKNSGDLALLTQKATLKNFTVVHQNNFMPLWYRLSLKKQTIETSIELSNYLYESGLFAAVDPAFMFDFKSNAVPPPCANDEYFGDLWGLNNAANPSVDLNACQAWTLSQGAGINVAVLDTGIDKNHIDLSSNIHPLSFDTCFGQGSSPSQLYGWHGTMVAGAAAAIKDNGILVSGIAPQSKLMDISNKLAMNATISEQLANGINWAYLNGAHIINNSWGDQGGANDMHSEILEQAIKNAMTFGRDGLGSIVVFASGNKTTIDYPAGIDKDIICVGGIRTNGTRVMNYGSPLSVSGAGPELDVVGPGENIYSTANGDDFDVLTGTSMAAPYIAGVAALILSVNPCLSQRQVGDIIERTAQKVGGYSYAAIAGKSNGTWNGDVGYGLVDAYAAVQLAQAMHSPTLDLMVRDGNDDFGIEPNASTESTANSTDIWVRNQNDGLLNQQHQNPRYNSNGNSNFVYVRITNKSCVASTGTDLLKLHFAVDKTWMLWPSGWSALPPVGQITIPVIQPGKEIILTIPWTVPNPASFSSNPSTVDGSNRFSILARIDTANDPMTFPETGLLNGQTVNPKFRFYLNVSNNNNIAWKSLMIIDVANKQAGGIVMDNLPDEAQNASQETLNVLSSIAPNPAKNYIKVGYKISSNTKAYLIVIGGYKAVSGSDKYVLDASNTEKNIDLSSYPSGFYTIALVCDGKIVDTKNVIKD